MLDQVMPVFYQSLDTCVIERLLLRRVCFSFYCRTWCLYVCGDVCAMHFLSGTLNTIDRLFICETLNQYVSFFRFVLYMDKNFNAWDYIPYPTAPPPDQAPSLIVVAVATIAGALVGCLIMAMFIIVVIILLRLVQINGNISSNFL